MEKHPELRNLIKIAKTLDGLKIPYYVTGGFAVSNYGRPRFTADIDMVIKMFEPKINEFAKNMQKVFPKGYIDKDQINDALARCGEFNIVDPESGLKVDFFITKDDEFEKTCFKRILIRDLGYKIKFASPEDLIINKLIWFKDSQSTRQLEDIISVMDVQKKLDMIYINKWIKKLGLEKEWQKLKELKFRS